MDKFPVILADWDEKEGPIIHLVHETERAGVATRPKVNETGSYAGLNIDILMQDDACWRVPPSGRVVVVVLPETWALIDRLELPGEDLDEFFGWLGLVPVEEQVARVQSLFDDD